MGDLGDQTLVTQDRITLVVHLALTRVYLVHEVLGSKLHRLRPKATHPSTEHVRVVAVVVGTALGAGPNPLAFVVALARVEGHRALPSQVAMAYPPVASLLEMVLPSESTIVQRIAPEPRPFCAER